MVGGDFTSHFYLLGLAASIHVVFKYNLRGHTTDQDVLEKSRGLWMLGPIFAVAGLVMWIISNTSAVSIIVSAVSGTLLMYRLGLGVYPGTDRSSDPKTQISDAPSSAETSLSRRLGFGVGPIVDRHLRTRALVSSIVGYCVPMVALYLGA